MAAPNILCDTAGMTNAQWLAARMHGPSGKIPYTVGGSDVAAVFEIALGIWFIRGPKARQPEDIPVFTPPVSEPWEAQSQPGPDISREASGAGDAPSFEQEAPRDEC